MPQWRCTTACHAMPCCRPERQQRAGARADDGLKQNGCSSGRIGTASPAAAQRLNLPAARAVRAVGYSQYSRRKVAQPGRPRGGRADGRARTDLLLKGADLAVTVLELILVHDAQPHRSASVPACAHAERGTHEQLALDGRGIRSVSLQRVGGGGELPRHFPKLSAKPLVVLSELHSGTRTNATRNAAADKRHAPACTQDATCNHPCRRQHGA